MRSDRSSRVVSTTAILGLIVTSLLMVLVLNSSSLVNPITPPPNNPPNSPGGPTGVLVVNLLSNSNESNPILNPRPTGQLLPVEALPITVTQVVNSSTAIPLRGLITTDKNGTARGPATPGSYNLQFRVEALDIKIPAHISLGNETVVNVRITGTAYQLLYSEESNVVPTAVGVQSSMFAQLATSSKVANDSELVILKMHEGTGVGGFLVNATVVSQEAPSQGKQWLEMGTASALNPVNVTSIDLTTWKYTSSVSVRPIGLSGPTSPPVTIFG